MKNKILRTIVYIFTRVLIVAIVLGILQGAFLSSTKTSNLYFVIQDALKARLDIILMHTDPETKAQFFSYDYLKGEEYSALRSVYSFYTVSGYSHKFDFDYGTMIVWPWQKKKTVTVREAVYTIIGELNTAVISKEDAKAKGIDKIPSWKSSVYNVTLVYENDSWMIDSVETVEYFEYQPPKTPSLTKEEIDALRTPSPAPTPTFAPGELTGERPATISNPIVGDKVNVRMGPATEYDVIEELPNGAKVTVMDESDGWYFIRTEAGNEGYVSGYYILFS